MEPKTHLYFLLTLVKDEQKTVNKINLRIIWQQFYLVEAFFKKTPSMIVKLSSTVDLFDLF